CRLCAVLVRSASWRCPRRVFVPVGRLIVAQHRAASIEVLGYYQASLRDSPGWRITVSSRKKPETYDDSTRLAVAEKCKSTAAVHSSSKRIIAHNKTSFSRGIITMRRIHLGLLGSAALASLALIGLAPQADSMCGYFRPVIVDVKNPSEMLQP